MIHDNSMAEKRRLSEARTELCRLQAGGLVDLIMDSVPARTLTPVVSALKASREAETNRAKEARRLERQKAHERV